MSETLPTYDADEPARIQETDADCAVESTEWALYAWGRTPDDNWLESSMLAAGVWNPSVGLCDASGAGLADWVNDEYGELGYWAENVDPVSFDDLAEEAALQSHPIMAGGRAFYHWVGVRGYDPGTDLLRLANPAPGWKAVWDTMSRAQFDALGSFSMVRLMHPAAEGMGPPPEELDYGPWVGRVGSGLLSALEADGVLPAQSQSTWLPLGTQIAEIEECAAENGVIYRWHLPSGSLWKYPPR